MSNVLQDEWKEINLDCEGENKVTSFFASEGAIHSYPAKAVPEMINSLLQKINQMYDIKNVLDPFVGSGTVALEAKYLGLDFYGCDLNPLAILLARTKALTIHNTPYVKGRLLDFTQYLISRYNSEAAVCLENFKNIDYWFKESNIRQLSFIKKQLEEFLNKSKSNKEVYALILLTAFSSTIRKSSLTRNGEFKLYRLSLNDISKFEVDSIGYFHKSVKALLDMLVVSNSSYEKDVISDICLNNAKNLSFVKDKKIDLIITSPPYGDSRSTVAYGQFSRLSLQWMDDLLNKYLGINCNYVDCDEYLLGGKKSFISLNENNKFFKSKTLIELIDDMRRIIKHETDEKNEIKKTLLKILDLVGNNKLDFILYITKNSPVFALIKERVRLDIYRIISKGKYHLSDKKVKNIAKIQSDNFMFELLNGTNKQKYRKMMQLKVKLPFLMQSINRKIQTLPRREEEVICFLKDLYAVVIEADHVLSNNGVQTWIVGHRTVLGKLVINMEGILKDWFMSMGYSVITSLQRKYSFKRMPNHINSTISRNDKINTMMYEYILIVKKVK